MTSLQAKEACKGDPFIDDFLVVHSKFGMKSNELGHVNTFSHPYANACKIKVVLGCCDQIH